jgi:hypothetical protein
MAPIFFPAEAPEIRLLARAVFFNPAQDTRVLMAQMRFAGIATVEARPFATIKPS